MLGENFSLALIDELDIDPPPSARNKGLPHRLLVWMPSIAGMNSKGDAWNQGRRSSSTREPSISGMTNVPGVLPDSCKIESNVNSSCCISAQVVPGGTTFSSTMFS